MRAQPKLIALIAAAVLIQFAAAAVRHASFHSTAFDLAIFDQALFLISRGEPPHSSPLGFHIIGDHAAWVLYPLALLYQLYPTPYWLFGLQSAALSLGAWPLYRMAQAAGLEQRDALVVACAYLLYPVVYNQGQTDFRPDVIAMPAILGAVWAARSRRPLGFALCVALALACKEVFGLTVASMGVWLWLCERRRGYGLAALVVGAAWFGGMALLVIPALTGIDAAASIGDERYAHLGSTVAEIASNILSRPALLFADASPLNWILYLVNLTLPVLWGLAPRHLAPLIGALPTLLLNFTSSWPRQRSLATQYSLPAVPFLFLAVLSAFAGSSTWIRDRRLILAWSLAAFLAFAHYPRLARYVGDLDEAAAKGAALATIPAEAVVLADNCVGAHLAQRRGLHLLGFAVSEAAPAIPADVELVVYDRLRPCSVDPAWFAAWSAGLGASFAPVVESGGVVVWRRR